MKNNIIIFILSIIFLVVSILAVQKQNFGKSPINKYLFILGKFSMFVSWAFFFIKALSPDLFIFNPPTYLEWFAVFLLLLAATIEGLAFLKLGKSTKLGLPDEKSILITKGIYSISRNPMYLGFVLICIASLIYNPNIFNIIFSIIGIGIHHKIIFAEERFLETNYLEEWGKYKKHTRRYL